MQEVKEPTITISASVTRSEVAATLLLMGVELSPELWERIVAMPHDINFNAIPSERDRFQVKAGLVAMLFDKKPQ